MNEVFFILFILSISLGFLFINKYVTIIIYILQFLWTPYEAPYIGRLINNVEVSMIVCAKVPLICFAILEWHAIYKVMRQFGFSTKYFR